MACRFVHPLQIGHFHKIPCQHKQTRTFFQLQDVLGRQNEEIAALKEKLAQLELKNLKPEDENTVDEDNEDKDNIEKAEDGDIGYWYKDNEDKDKIEKAEEQKGSSPVHEVRGAVNDMIDCVLKSVKSNFIGLA